MVDRVDSVGAFAGRLAAFAAFGLGMFLGVGYAADAVFGGGIFPAFAALGGVIVLGGMNDAVRQYRRDRRSFAARVADIRARDAAGKPITFFEARIAGLPVYGE